ncbi:hypothetical protein H5T55_04550 [Candidatus Bipolaricaulota bacterium]|nr:hypothetical protein [Candidatus Bipolaricaulota bacterium]
MRTVAKGLLAAGVAALAWVGLGGCFWISKDLPATTTVFFSDLIGNVDGPGEVTVTVAQVPCDGLAALAVGWGGIGLRFDPAQFQVTDVQGVNGFVVLAKFIDNTGGEVRFVAVNPGAGVATGDVVRIIGARLGAGDAGLTVEEGNLQLAGACGDLVATYELTTGRGAQYFVKEGQGCAGWD